MKFDYILKYAWNDLWHFENRSFTYINLIAVCISTTILILLSGAFIAFQANRDKMVSKTGLRIEVNAAEDRQINNKEEKDLLALEGVDTVHWWTPTILLFYNKQGRLFDGIGGRTIDANDPLMESLKDVRTNKRIAFKNKKELGTVYDEVGIIVPFIVLKRLSFIPAKARGDRPETWKDVEFPKYLKIMIRESKRGAQPIDLKLPIVGIVSELEGRYLLTKDCYKIIGNKWQNDFRGILKDRNGKNIFPEFAKEKISITFIQKMQKIIGKQEKDYATVYAKNRNNILPLIKNIRELGLKADCSLEDYLGKYKQQELFFMAVAGGICIVMLFFSGVVLFATFQALILRKFKEIGILKASGANNTLVYKIFLMESVIMASKSLFIGIVIGILTGVFTGNYIQKALEYGQKEIFVISYPSIAAIFFLGVSFCVAITFLPIRVATGVEPDKVMRGA